MSSLGDILRAPGLANGEPTSPAPSKSSFGLYQSWQASQSVGHSPDLARIVALPRRVLKAPPDSHWDSFRKLECPISGCPFYAPLREIQSAALLEIETQGGAFCSIGVGEGKTLISLLAGTVLGFSRVSILVPPAVKSQLLEVDIPHLSQHWKLPKDLYVVTYSDLSSRRTGGVLDQLDPELVCADECHSVSHYTSARTKRFWRFFKTHPLAKLVALSGTITDQSIRDYWRFVDVILDTRSPLPRRYPVLEEWACAIDPSEFQADPGALRVLCRDDESVQDGYRRRLVDTPGVVATAESKLKTSLYLHRHNVKTPASVRKALTGLRETWATPGGEEISDSLSYWAAARELAMGMYLIWTWPRGESTEVQARWLNVRKAYHREIRHTLAHRSKPGFDSEALLSESAARGEWQSEFWAEWREVQHTAKPSTEAVWIDKFLLESALAWGSKHNGIIWYEHNAVGTALAGLSGFAQYGGGEKADRAIRAEDGTRPIVASLDAHWQGKNLQAFASQLFLAAPTSSKIAEQAIGRSHRQGQKAEQVDVWFCLHTPELVSGFVKARAKAVYAERTTGAGQKLSYGQYTFDVASL